MNETVVFAEAELGATREPLVDGLFDFGLLVEALVFYDRIYLNAPRPEAFVSLCRRLAMDGDMNDFLALLRAGEIVLLDHDHHTCIQIEHEGSTAAKATNLRDPLSIAGRTFEVQSLGAPELAAILSGSQRVKLRRAALKNLTLIRLDQRHEDSLVLDATADYADMDKVALALRQLAEGEGVPMPPGPLAREIVRAAEGFVKVSWIPDLERLSGDAQKRLGADKHVLTATSPLGAFTMRNRMLRAARAQGADVHASRPLDQLVARKLEEAGNQNRTATSIVCELMKRADFPDIRTEANLGLIKLSDALRFRKKAGAFRRWLHQERTQDRDAILAYLGEFETDAGIRGIPKRFISIAVAAAGTALGGVVGGHAGAVAGAAIGSATGGAAEQFLTELKDGLIGNWKPVVFGSWLSREIPKAAMKRKQ
jgi:hypothetical protein